MCQSPMFNPIPDLYCLIMAKDSVMSKYNEHLKRSLLLQQVNQAFYLSKCYEFKKYSSIIN